MAVISYEFTVGRLLCAQVREYLAQKAFLNPQMRWREGSGVFSRTFQIQAEESIVSGIHATLVYWKEQLDKARERHD